MLKSKLLLSIIKLKLKFFPIKSSTDVQILYENQDIMNDCNKRLKDYELEIKQVKIHFISILSTIKIF
jgi:hypothetical protein